MTSADRPMLDRLLARSPVQGIARRRAAGQLAVLAYHGVDDVARFASHLDWLAAETRPVSLDDAVAGLAGRRSLPPRAVLVTFDDGHRSVLDHAAPLLAALQVPAVLFAVAGLVGTNRPFWWTEVEELVRAGARAEGLPVDGREAVRFLKGVSDAERRDRIESLRRQAGQPAHAPQLTAAELRTLEASGVAIGNHTLTHPILARCDDAGIEQELVVAHQVLVDALGHRPSAFAYPNGDFDPRVPPVLRRLAYEVGFLFDHRLSAVPAADPFRVSRVRVNSTTSSDRFQTIVSGLHPALHRWRGRS